MYPWSSGMDAWKCVCFFLKKVSVCVVSLESQNVCGMRFPQNSQPVRATYDLIIIDSPASAASSGQRTNRPRRRGGRPRPCSRRPRPPAAPPPSAAALVPAPLLPAAALLAAAAVAASWLASLPPPRLAQSGGCWPGHSAARGAGSRGGRAPAPAT